MTQPSSPPATSSPDARSPSSAPGPFATIDEIAAHYAQALAEYGPDDARAVGWHQRYNQLGSFFLLTAIEGLTPGATLLDVGCGLGDFKAFLDRRGIKVDYTGWDICEPLVEEARRRHPDGRFACRDILASPCVDAFDIVVCAGALSLRLPEHETWRRAMLQAMYRACRRGMVVTMLSHYFASDQPAGADPERHDYASPELLLSECLALSRRVSINHADLAQVFAVYVYKSNPVPVERVAAHLLAEVSAQGGSKAPELGHFGREHEVICAYYESLGLYEELIAWLRTLPPSAAVWDRIGITSHALGDYRRQVAAFAKAAELDPMSTVAWRHLAIAHMDQGAFAEAIPALERAADLDPDSVFITYRLGYCYEQTGAIEHAMAAYRAVLARDPAHPGARQALGRLAT